ncbi:hypothetical protein FSPOR_9081 [Fusarium sporotrichioides]|uniref:Uncharacterized protein n=1 Tax=Fusarium sporotrichioides TaxID=5514 RepID=A0A395RRQ9_FUSSP|nr:hypothetical protein FSPOR_9081 [Fusarium sporotrichioides]
MRFANVVSAFVAHVLMTSGPSASPCKPSTASSVSTSIIETTSYHTTSTAVASPSIVETYSATRANTETITGAAGETTTWVTDVSSAIPSSIASDASEPIPTFKLVAANAAVQTEVNGETLKFKTSYTRLLIIRPVAHASGDFETGYFSVEPLTNRLKMGNVFVIAPASPNGSLGTATDDYRAKYVICTPPLVVGQKLSCVAENSDRDQWMINTGAENSLFIRSGEEELGPDDSFDFVDMVVG